MNKLFPSLLLAICLIGIFACNKAEDIRKESKISEDSPRQVEQANLEGENGVKPDGYISTSETENHPPHITSIKIVNVSDNNIRGGFRAVVQAKDPDGDEVGFKYQWKLNGEEIVGATEGVLEFQQNFKKGDEISVEVIPSDGKNEGIWKAEGSFIIPNSPPKIVSEPEGRMEGGSFSYVVKAEDPDGDPIEFTLKDAPKGMEIGPATGLITWNFSENDTGEYKVQVIASDPEGAKAIQELVLTVP